MLDTESINARLKAFDDEHGNHIFVDGWFLFEDGAVREENPLGVLKSPPKAAWERAKKILLYHEIRLKRAIKEFDRFKHSLMSYATHARDQVDSTPPPPKEQMDKLKAMQLEIIDLKKTVEKAEKEMESNVPEGVKARKEQSEANRQANQNFLAELNGINV